jgi:hypothetical protein
MNSVSFGFIAIFSVILSFNLALCQYGYNQNQFGGGQMSAVGAIPTYSQSQTTAYQQQPNGQQTTVVQEVVQGPTGNTKTVVTKTVTNPIGTQNIGSNYAQTYGGGYGGKK